jgi:hypothetical protein
MTYSQPRVERTRFVAHMAATASCANVRCDPGYVCSNGQCVDREF